jgi:hypothetical protein
MRVAGAPVPPPLVAVPRGSSTIACSAAIGSRHQRRCIRRQRRVGFPRNRFDIRVKDTARRCSMLYTSIGFDSTTTVLHSVPADLRGALGNCLSW